MTNEQIAKQAAEDILTWRMTTTIKGATKIILDAMEKAKKNENHRMLEILSKSDFRTDYEDD